MRIIFDDAVLEELVEQSAYYAEVDAALAGRFLDACDACFEFLKNNVEVGSARTFEDIRLKDVRMWRVKGFEKHLVFYLPIEEGIRLLHVVHSAVDYNRAFEDD
jgi:toxin ParE1/3/4